VLTLARHSQLHPSGALVGPPVSGEVECGGSYPTLPRRHGGALTQQRWVWGVQVISFDGKWTKEWLGTGLFLEDNEQKDTNYLKKCVYSIPSHPALPLCRFPSVRSRLTEFRRSPVALFHTVAMRPLSVTGVARTRALTLPTPVSAALRPNPLL
jgi:hypothetical protein